MQNYYQSNFEGQPVYGLRGNNFKGSRCLPPVYYYSTEVMTNFCFMRTLAFKMEYRDGNRFKSILQNEIKPHYDKVGTERGKGMFLRMKVSPNFTSYFCCANFIPASGGKFKIHPGKS